MKKISIAQGIGNRESGIGNRETEGSVGSVGSVGRWGDGDIFIKGNYPDMI
ncbi:MAG: hypothetical protein F6J90_04895 [Moorea sp. SIOASIH]|uniref:hypothetical protein n=1 Tax=Moorena sp. SIOASIH TaxID=2607817 RepID=UPI0013B82388|nr:hypothetical protein [Moorena sp. SIOASIH]NEO35693.1 hypothetical protein [Moorena sp. SIOASIH]